MEFIEFLESYSGALTVIVTVVYVVNFHLPLFLSLLISKVNIKKGAQKKRAP